ncbi:MAG: right-handed parallel beta-helix repeat-containing protein [Candidatus Glassbacteria bacterium]|nr:right-handed parallel beta-helix repeat-containing protein [Candidatus Glassbacteria bacterium]
MNKLSAVAAAFCLCLISLAFADPESPNPRAVPTFECLGLYYTLEAADDPGECGVRYRTAGGGEWREVIPLFYNVKDSQFRGSIVGLVPDTEYEVELIHKGKTAKITARTMSEEFPVGKTTHLPDGTSDTQLEITESGTPDGWHLVTVSPGGKHVIDPEKTRAHNIVIEGSYIIVRGLELRMAGQDAIYLKRGSHHIVIEDCHIINWGRGDRRMAWLGWGDSAVRAAEGVGDLVIQRNLIEHPTGWTNDWDTGHPSGPQAITVRNSSGHNIFRHNEIISTEDHGYNDAIGGGSNYSWEGAPNRDSDIYGNIVTNVWDDAIEAEGANMNVRIWGNYIDHVFTHIATATTSRGPLYIFRNVFGVSRRTQKNPTGGPMIKVGGDNREFRGGRRYVFHNTALQPHGAFRVFSTHQLSDVISRNNLYDCPGVLTGIHDPIEPLDFQYDMFTGIPNGKRWLKNRVGGGRPAFEPSQGLEWFPAVNTTRVKWGRTEVEHAGRTWRITDKVIRVPNPMIDSGEVLPGFNDNYAGAGPDIGAFERGRPPLKFGRRAGRKVILAPWEVK